MDGRILNELQALCNLGVEKTGVSIYIYIYILALFVTTPDTVRPIFWLILYDIPS